MSKGKELRKPKTKGKQAVRSSGDGRVQGSPADAPDVGLRVGKTESTVPRVTDTRNGGRKK
jgi:hypothetical protein